MATGAFAAVDDRQDDRLALATLTLQAEETDRVVRIQTVTAALTDRLEVGLLSGKNRMGEHEGLNKEERKGVSWSQPGGRAERISQERTEYRTANGA